MAEHLANARRVRHTRLGGSSRGDEWRDLRTWPLITTEQVLHPGTDGCLRSTAGTASASFGYNAADRTPTVGGRVMFIGGKTDDGTWSR